MEFTIIEKILKIDSIKPIIPLGRYLSESAVESLEARIEKREVTELLDSLILSKGIGN
ncbi:hypothetical protein [Yeosuana marina]|uniref:hypothetical protein n=1 Tax=Yeosuana marina TaxID=1565536 RepID=UPI0030C82F59